MGRLFWKFFAFSWLAQMAGILVVAATFWFASPQLDAMPPGGRPGPQPAGPPPRAMPRPPPPAGLLGPVSHIRGMPPLGALLAMLGASLATAAGLAWYVSKPIRSLRSAFAAVASGDLQSRVGPRIGGRQDELADLGRDFDRMAARLEASMEDKRRLLHDVSHEVRSPLARLQTAVGLVRLKYGRSEPAIERMEEEIVRIDSLISDLLTLSRIEAGELHGPVEEIDLQELVRGVVDDANFEARNTGRSVVWAHETAGTLQGRADLLHGAIENIVRNALKHAPGCPQIQVETGIDAARRLYTVRVLDTGPGVAKHELAGIFTPFFRAGNVARSEGYGLGMAISRRSVEAHGGTIMADNRSEGGFAVTITLPLRGGIPRQSAVAAAPTSA